MVCLIHFTSVCYNWFDGHVEYVSDRMQQLESDHIDPENMILCGPLNEPTIDQGTHRESVVLTTGEHVANTL